MSVFIHRETTTDHLYNWTNIAFTNDILRVSVDHTSAAMASSIYWRQSWHHRRRATTPHKDVFEHTHTRAHMPNIRLRFTGDILQRATLFSPSSSSSSRRPSEREFLCADAKKKKIRSCCQKSFAHLQYRRTNIFNHICNAACVCTK